MAAMSSWGDESAVGIGREILPAPHEEGPDEQGLKTLTVYRRNDKGQVEKVVKTTRITVLRREVPSAVEEREARWVKFGQAKGATQEGVTYPSAEEIKIEQADQAQKSQLELMSETGATSVVVCRRCGGSHWTLSCPFKDLKNMPAGAAGRSMGFGGDGGAGGAGGGGGEGGEGAAPVSRWGQQMGQVSGGAGQLGSGGGKYVPPSQRNGAGADDGKEREVPFEELTQLRVSSLSSEADEDDLRLLFRQFGMVDKIFVAKDKETGVPRGFAFVRYMSHDHAAAAKEAMDGYPFMHLVLKVDWSRPDNRPREGGGVYTGYGKALAHDSSQAQRATYH
jgi:translation initiation factor 3 subunit G